MSIGLNIVYRDPAREELYWPYLRRCHLRDCVWPLVKTSGLERVELLEVVCVYDSADALRELVGEWEVFLDRFDDPESIAVGYPDRGHVLDRTVELLGRLRGVLAEWPEVKEVVFF